MLIAIDTGGTKTLVTGFSRSGKPSGSHLFPTPKNHEDYVATLVETLYDNYSKHTIDAIVIGIPGIINEGIVTWAGGNLPWTNLDLVTPLSDTFHCPVFVENDANLAGLAETRSLKTKPACALYVTISTGIGTGIITNGQINPSLARSEGGHSLVEYDGRLQQWESFASGRAIKQTYGKFARDITSKSVWRQIADKISRGFLPIIPVLQPDVIIIGGSIGTYFERYGDTLARILTDHLPAHIAVPQIRQAVHPEQAVVYGCYYYGKDKLARR